MQAIFDESLVTGNELIDEQHKELIGKINDLVKSCETGKEKTTAVKMLDYLSDYTDFHFSAEENFRKKSDIHRSANIKNSIKHSSRQLKNCTKCFRKKKDLHLHLLQLWIRMLPNGCLNISKDLIKQLRSMPEITNVNLQSVC